MAISEAVSPSIGAQLWTPGADPASTSDDPASSSSWRQTAGLWVATVLALALVAAWGYLAWWVPLQHAETAQASYQHCLDEVAAYQGKHTYADRLAQCSRFLQE